MVARDFNPWRESRRPYRGDADFYAELDQKLRDARRNEIRWLGTKKQRRRAAVFFLQTHPRVKSAWDWGRNRSRPLRKLLKAWFGWNLTDAV